MIPSLLEKIAGGLIGVALLLAPFFYGGTTDEAIHFLNVLLLTAGSIWMLSCLVEQRWPTIPRAVALGGCVLLIQGWWMTFNAHSFFDPEFWQSTTKQARVAGLPGSRDAFGSRTTMIRLTALIIALFAMVDLCRKSRWIRWNQGIMAVASIALAAVGIWQKIAFKPLKIWAVDQVPSTTFATFWYHGNAAAFLNSTWPLVLASAFCAFPFGATQLMRSVWITGILLTFAAVAINVSKAGHLIAALMVALLFLMLIVRVRTLMAQYGWRQILIGASAGFVGVLWLLMQLDTSITLQRWKVFLARDNLDSRITVAGQSFDMMKDTGWFGSGPGTFAAVFHEYRKDHSIDTKVAWKYAHNDFVQAAVEWGLPGTLAWAAIWGSACFAGAMVMWKWIKPAFLKIRKRSRSNRERWARSREAMLQIRLTGAALGLFGLLLHAAMDFPLQIYSTQLYGLALAAMLISRNKGIAPGKAVPAEADSE
jgi:hypothetical protein